MGVDLLVFGPHPDDLEIGLGGTIARHVASGSSVGLCDLTAGEINLDDTDKKKSEGVLYPASQLIVNKEGELQFELRQNPWKLLNIIDWNGAGKDK